MMGEFALIEKYFSGLVDKDGESTGVATGIGDDAAVLDITPGKQLVTATDTLVADVHFPGDADPELIARRALRVNLSDMAAMGATPRWFTLALTLPTADELWVQGFSAGLAEDARRFHCHLVGGDTTRGPLAITLHLMGEVDPGQAILRSGAKPGDAVFLSGAVGFAAAALEYLGNPEENLSDWQRQLLEHYFLPEPKIELGLALRGSANAAIDVSDGLLADVGHIARLSGVEIEINCDDLPGLQTLQQNFPLHMVQRWQLSGGDDYQLCFTMPPASLADLMAKLQGNPDIVAIGQVIGASHGGKVVCRDQQGNAVNVEKKGYSHF